MPKRTDIKSILVIGAGPIVIGQACEFDYSGTQACKALKEEGYKVILINSNPATIMTDSGIADSIYIEPIIPSIIESIIKNERPDALLATVGGQTALNNAVDLAVTGVLNKYNVELIGVNETSIQKAEDRKKFNDTVTSIGLKHPKNVIINNLAMAEQAMQIIGLPAVLRPSFTLGGSGGGIAHTKEQFMELVQDGLNNSLINQIQIDESLIGWKEFELEMICDKKGNHIVICGIENIDPMGVHTGDSITIAPIMTLRDDEYQLLRKYAIQIMDAVGIESGGANIQFAVKGDQVRVIEMNPRVSRSSALASKATGFPIAKVTARLAVGYSLGELQNDCIPSITASFEPAIDYIVTKIPRFDFDKFAIICPELNTKMQSVGEVMAIGRCFKESIHKAIASLELGYEGFNTVLPENLTTNEIRAALQKAVPNKIMLIADALRHNININDIHILTGYDKWFIRQISDLMVDEAKIQTMDFESDPEYLLQCKKMGFSDARLATLSMNSLETIKKISNKFSIKPVFKRIDNCAAEFPSNTSYLYSCYEGSIENPGECESNPSNRNKVIVIGSGPNRIGQGLEFDYACIKALNTIRNCNMEAIIINCNPETVSTDYDISDKLYFSPITTGHVLNIARKEQENGNLLGVIIQFGGQTPLKIAKSLIDANIPILGTQYASIDITEDRNKFQKLISSLSLMQPANTICNDINELREQVSLFGFPMLIRPSYVLGGKSMAIINNEAELDKYLEYNHVVCESDNILLDQFIGDAIEVDVDAICDGKDVYIAGVLEHIESAGVHSGDSACAFPAHTLSKETIEVIKLQTRKLSLALNARGLVNIQFAVKEENIYVLEVNLRASRTVPFISKATNYPIASIATEIILGYKTLKELNLKDYEQILNHTAVKEAVFPFSKFPNADVLLGPEMKSTGEVMGIDKNFPRAFAKAQIASGNILPLEGTVLISVQDQDKDHRLINVASELSNMGFKIVATRGTAKFLFDNEIKNVVVANKFLEGSPHIIDILMNGEIAFVINTVSGLKSIEDSKTIRRTSLMRKIPYCTTVSASTAVIMAIKELNNISIKPMHEYFD